MEFIEYFACQDSHIRAETGSREETPYAHRIGTHTLCGCSVKTLRPQSRRGPAAAAAEMVRPCMRMQVVICSEHDQSDDKNEEEPCGNPDDNLLVARHTRDELLDGGLLNCFVV